MTVSWHAIFSNLNVTTKKQKCAEVSLWFHRLWVLTLRSYLKTKDFRLQCATSEPSAGQHISLQSLLSVHHRYGMFKQPVNEHFTTDANRYELRNRSTLLTGNTLLNES